MAVAGGDGTINLAVQDAVATARLLAGPLVSGIDPTQVDRVLPRVRRRRLMPTVLTQAMQRVLHAQFIERVLDGRLSEFPSRLPEVMRRMPALAAVPAFGVGVGVRPERAPDWARRRATSDRSPSPAVAAH